MDQALKYIASLALTENIHLRTVGEGAECQEHIDFLKENGCDYVQGYFIARPMPFDELKNILTNWQPKTNF